MLDYDFTREAIVSEKAHYGLSSFCHCQFLHFYTHTIVHIHQLLFMAEDPTMNISSKSAHTLFYIQIWGDCNDNNTESGFRR